MATVNLGSIKFNWKGAYSGATAYVVDDVVESGGSTYVCILASTGNTPPNATYWELMSQAGTNGTDGADGTDLTTTLTTQGDIVYRDGTGLARLGAGTSGQVLQTNGTGANPSWVDAGGGTFTVLGSTNVTSSVSDVTFSNFVNSAYDTYMIEFSQVNGVNGGGDLFFNQYTGSWNTSGYKIHVNRLPDDITSYASFSSSNESGWIVGRNLQESGGYGCSGRIYFHNLGSSTAYTVATWLCFGRQQNGTWTLFNGGGASSLTSAATQIRVQDNFGNIDTGKFTLFGIKNS